VRTIAIVNQKGGCGKTTTAINLAGVLARFRQRTLLVDLDPQSHCAAGLAIPEDRIELHIGDAMLASTHQAIDETRLLWRIRNNLDLAPSSMRLAGLEAARGGIADTEDCDERLARALDRWRERYDLCLIDCPPSIGLLTFNALRAADEVLIPVETGFFAMQGAGRQINTIRSLARRLGGDTPYRLLVTMHDENSSLALELLAELKRRFGDRVAPVIIRLDGKLKDAASMGQPIIEYAPTSIGSQDYSDLAAWLLGRSAPARLEDPSAEALSQPFRTAELSTSAIEPKPLGDVLAANKTAQATQPTAAQTSPSLDDADPIVSRAAELATRARQLLYRGAALQKKLQNDPDVSRAMNKTPGAPDATVTTIPTDAPAPTDPIASPRVHTTLANTGPVETPHGVVFRHRAGPTAQIAVAGEFNHWSPAATPMRYNPLSGLHEASVALPPGRCEYRLVVQGVWTADPSNPSTTVNPFGETNSVFVVARRASELIATEGAD